MAKPKKITQKNKPTKPATSRHGHSLLVAVVCFLLTTITVQQFLGSPEYSRRHRTGSVNLGGLDAHSAEPQRRSKKPATVSTRPVAPLEAWHGPLQPLRIAAGPPPVITTVPTTEPVVFVTIDDGWVQTLENHDWLVSHHLPFSLFLSEAGVRNNHQYFQDLQSAGMTIQDHTVNHPSLAKLNLLAQQAEICGAADSYQNVFHHRPTLFRPPYGIFNALTQQASAACGMKAIVMWRATMQNGALQYQDNNTGLKAGDIVLMHFQPDLVANMQALAVELDKEHFQVAHLEDWLK